jgi:8-amino-7-oxononanoate synthase
MESGRAGDGEDPLGRLRRAAAARHAVGLHRALHPRSADHDGLLDLASNDYLGLSRDPRLVAGAVRAVRAWGPGATGSRLVTGTTKLHAALEDALADFTACAAALVLSSGYLANLATVTALATALRCGQRGGDGDPGSGVLIVSDVANHASLIDACRLSRARVVVTAHRDVTAVRTALAARCEASALVVTDAVFSVSGELAPLAELHRTAREHSALLIVDEAHAFGVVGPGGRGGAHAAGIAGELDVVRTVTLSKSLAGQGGAVLGAREIIETVIDIGRPFIFDTGLAPACAGAALAALEVLAQSPWLADQARMRALRLAAVAAGHGYDTSRPDAAVVSVTLGPPEAALTARRVCAEHGVGVACFRPPSVPAGRSCLRMAARPDLTDADFHLVDRALAAIRPFSAQSPAGEPTATAPARPGPARPGPAQPGPAAPGPAAPGPALARPAVPATAGPAAAAADASGSAATGRQQEESGP